MLAEFSDSSESKQSQDSTNVKKNIIFRNYLSKKSYRDNES